MTNKIFLQCGYEDKCKKKDCLKCPRKTWYELNLTLAEEIAVEDFAVGDLDGFLSNKNDEELKLYQSIMYKLMKKLFRSEVRKE